MGIEDIRIDGLQGPQEPGKPNAPLPGEGTEFRRLLEKLETVARDSKPAEVADIDKLQDAVKRADDDFRAVMDLRRQLEDAYRNNQP